MWHTCTLQRVAECACVAHVRAKMRARRQHSCQIASIAREALAKRAAAQRALRKNAGARRQSTREGKRPASCSHSFCLCTAAGRREGPNGPARRHNGGNAPPMPLTGSLNDRRARRSTACRRHPFSQLPAFLADFWLSFARGHPDVGPEAVLAGGSAGRRGGCPRCAGPQ